MPRTNYVPDMYRPIGFAMPYIKEPTNDDKPTVEVDIDAEGMRDGLIEAVCTALELWNPVFDHWEDPPTRLGTRTPRKVPVFRGKHADKVRKFRDDILRYTKAHPIEQQKVVFLNIASKYVHIRPMNGPRATGRGQDYPLFPHFDLTPYTRDVIRPVIRPSDPEWRTYLIRSARSSYMDGDAEEVNRIVKGMISSYDDNHKTFYGISYYAEVMTLDRERAPLWEYWRLVAHYVAGICDREYLAELNPFEDLRPTRKVPTARKRAATSVRRPVRS